MFVYFWVIDLHSADLKYYAVAVLLQLAAKMGRGGEAPRPVAESLSKLQKFRRFDRSLNQDKIAKCKYPLHKWQQLRISLFKKPTKVLSQPKGEPFEAISDFQKIILIILPTLLQFTFKKRRAMFTLRKNWYICIKIMNAFWVLRQHR